MKVPSPIVGRTRPSNTPMGMLSAAGGTPDAFGAGVGKGLTVLAAAFKQREQATDRFQSLSNFSDFETAAQTRLIEAQRNADPTGRGFAVQAEGEYEKAQQEFLQTKVAPELREEFAYRANQVKNKIIGQSLDFQYKAGDAYFREGVDKEYQKALTGLDPSVGGDPTQLPAYRARINEAIDSTDLSDIEKHELKAKTARGLEGVSYKQAVKEAVKAGAVSGGSDLIKSEEGFRPTPYWDVNAYRVGYGSDTVTLEDGSVKKVVPGMRITKADADRDLQRRYKEFASEAATAVGPAWGQLDGNTRAALTSVAYNYGSLGKGGANIVAAVRTGDRETIAQAVEDLGSNKKRRRREAAVIRGGGEPTTDIIDQNPAFGSLTYEDRINLRHDAITEATREQTANAKQQKEAYEAQLNQLLVGVQDGSLGHAAYDAGVQDGWLTDFSDRAKVLDALKKYQEETELHAEAVKRISVDNPVFDPSDKHDRDLLNSFVGKEGREKIANMDTDYVGNGIIPLSHRANDIPTDVVGQLTGMMRANNQQQALFALDTLRQLEEAEPRAYAARVPEAVQKDVDFYTARKDLYSADQLMELINGGHDQKTRQANAVLRKEAQDYLAQKEGGVATLSTLVGNVAGEFGGLFSTPTLGALPAYAKSLDSDYQTAFVDAYTKTADVDKANELAVKSLKRTWGVTAAGGSNVLMKYPPEKSGYQPIDGSYDWIDRVAREELGLKQGENFQLISDEQTKNEFQRWQAGKGPKPSYVVVKLDEMGTPIPPPLDAQGNMERRFFEPTPEIKAEQERSFVRKDARVRLDELELQYDGARLLQVQKGIPVPQELTDEVNRLRKILSTPENPDAVGMHMTNPFNSPVYETGAPL